MTKLKITPTSRFTALAALYTLDTGRVHPHWTPLPGARVQSLQLRWRTFGNWLRRRALTAALARIWELEATVRRLNVELEQAYSSRDEVNVERINLSDTGLERFCL